ncbi:unnamed protein product [Hermetia illucens]|uniref:F-box domain-containing protein n=1 Tax=Hermetia illucens TaxID=343691 RepID=A0A7R8UGG2_HERIL|nr:transmembrane protein 183 [Hermetia illucens]CAD7080149.1 unnamed protein product [Hermetia illucens]
MSNKSSKDWKLYNNLTVLDFADSPRTCKRLPKGKLGVKGLTESVLVEETTSDADTEEALPARGVPPDHKESSTQQADHQYNDLQLDIWFLISEHIPPEDVGRFALICQKTRYVVSTAKFWFHLYRKCYNRKVELPVCLQPESLGHLRELRSCVIRALFYLYPPFVERLRTPSDPTSLLKFKCVAVWYRRVKDYWSLCYKFSRSNGRLSQRDFFEEEEVDNWEDIDVSQQAPTSNIHTNPEEGNRILVVTTDRFYPPPDFMAPNLHLTKIIQPLSQSLREFKLEMSFSEYNGKKVGIATYDPIKQCKILKWWEPEYYSYLS